MQFVTIVILLVILSMTQAVVLPWLSIPLVLLNVNQQVEGIFSFFRRRPTPKPSIRKDIPEGPIRPTIPNISPQRFNMNPFGSFGFPSFPSFPGGFQANRFPQQPMQQPWFSQSMNVPPTSALQSTKQNFPSGQQFAAQSMNFQQNPNFGPGQSFVQSQRPEESNFGSESFDIQNDRDVRFDDQAPPINTEEAESFFTLLAETDENKCISRLVCEMGADPKNAGDLGKTVDEIIGSLTDFPSGSKVAEYNEILTKGRAQGVSSCLSEFQSCDDETYILMKNNQPDEAELAEGASAISE